MYRVLIVDDEDAIRQGIADGAPWKSWGFEIAATCANGLEALAMVEKTAPDVLLSDIRMPKMDGVELMQAVSSRWPDIKIVILSGYSDFEYLNMSIKNNVVEYLLKPTDLDDFEKLFRKLKLQLDEKQAQAGQLAQANKLRYNNQLNLLLRGRYDAGVSVRKLVQALGLSFSQYCVLLLTPDGHLADDEQALYTLKQRIVAACNLYMSQLPYHFLIGYDDTVAGVVSLTGQALLADRQAFAAGLQAFVCAQCGVTVSIGASYLAGGYQMLAAAYQQAYQSLRQAMFLGAQSIFFYDELIEDTVYPDCYFNLDAIKAALLTNQYDNLKREVNRVFAAYQKQPHRNYEYLDKLCMEALLNISRWALAYGCDFEKTVRKLGTSFQDIARCDSMDKKSKFMVALLYALQAEIAPATAKSKRTALAVNVKNIVDREYCSNIMSLEYVAQLVRKTPAHISRVFKNEIGCNFSEYLTQKRMQHAAGLLAQADVKIYEVATTVGYVDPSNFIKVFRKQYGVSPNEYREAMQRQARP